MTRWVALGVVAQLAVDAVVGIRLLALAARTRRLPELSFGLAFVLLGAVGYPLAIAARSGGLDPDRAGALLAAGLVTQDAACFALAVGVRHVFRRSDAWAGALLAALGAAYLAAALGHGLTIGYRGAHDGGSWYGVGLAARTAAFAWAGVEAVLYHRLLRRRLRLGLADPVVTDRFRLWAIASGAVVFAFAAFTIGRFTTPNVGQSPTVLACTSAGGLVAAVALWLAFLPPRAYLRRVALRGARP